jgi:hypothetical protein
MRRNNFFPKVQTLNKLYIPQNKKKNIVQKPVQKTNQYPSQKDIQLFDTRKKLLKIIHMLSFEKNALQTYVFAEKTII